MNKALIGGGLALCACALAIAKNPAVMKVNGVEVPRSEFEYLYHKNGQQQMEQQSFDDYVELFKIYKLKVADALSSGIDTTAAFKKELAQYRTDLAAPYLTDSAYIETFVKEAYDFLQEDAEIKHILRFKQNSNEANEASKVLLDSLATCIRNGEDFSMLAREYSQDKSVVNNGGNLGYMPFTKIPFYTFMKTAYTLQEDEVSPVVESPTAYHILVGGKHRPARGTMHAAHIMKMVRPGSDAAAEEKAKATIDSIYNVLQQDPTKFEELARTLSDDVNSGRNGGMLPWFGTGDMVPAFDEAAWALQDGETSAPVKSPYGWHIIRRFETKAPATYAERKPELVQRITNPKDERATKIRDHQIQYLSKKRKAKVAESALAQMKNDAQNMGVDSTFKALYLPGGKMGNITLITVNGKTATTGDFTQQFLNAYTVPAASLGGAELVEEQFQPFCYSFLTSNEEEQLMNEEPDYGNLYREFRDGSLLYEISLAKVWDKASKDEAGLKKFFEQHRGDYTWTEPHVKGYLVQAADDSVADVVRQRMQELGSSDSLTIKLRKEFRGKAQIDKVLFAKGQNPMVDYLVFGGAEVKSPSANFQSIFMFDPVILKNPEEVNDVRGLVTSDYQNQLETEWIEELKNKYPVEVYPKELNKVRKK